MKINHKELERLYKDFLEDIQPITRSECPLPQDFIDYVRNECSTKKKNLIIDHVAQCIYCFEEFKFVLEIVREEEKFINDLQDLIPKRKQRVKNKFRLYTISFRPIWIYGLIFIMGAVLISLLVRNISKEQKYRGNETHEVTLISPKVTTEQKTRLEFKWKEVNKSDYFILEIFDEALHPVWISDKIKVNQITLSEEISDMLSKHKTYYWMVTAYLSDAKTIESRLQEFSISD